MKRLFLHTGYILKKIQDVYPSLSLRDVSEITKHTMLSLTPLRKNTQFQKEMQTTLATWSQRILGGLHEASTLASKRLIHFDQYCQLYASSKETQQLMKANPRLAEMLLERQRGGEKLEPNIEEHVSQQIVLGKKKPSQILHDFESQCSQTRSDCGRAVELVFWMTIWKILGDAKFDHILSLPGMKFHVGSGGAHHRSEGSSLHWFTSPPAFPPVSVSNIRVGTRCTLDGLPYFRLKHPFGISNTTHAICFGVNNKTKESLFWSLDFPATLSSYKEITAKHIEDYNQPPSQLTLQLLQENGVDPFSLNPSHLASGVVRHVIEKFVAQYGNEFKGKPWPLYFEQAKVASKHFTKREGLKEIKMIEGVTRGKLFPVQDQICPGYLSYLDSAKIDELTLANLMAAKTIFLCWQILRPHFFDYYTGSQHFSISSQ